MGTDGEGGGGGGEAERRGRSELGRLLEAIQSSEVLEKRIQLIKQLEGSSRFSADDLGLILQALLASWIDSTCSGVSHCTLHRSILQVALKCSALDITDYLGQFLTLGEKASSWCEKHLQWSVKCIDESELVQEEEHDRLRLEINSLSFSICTKLLRVAAKCFTVRELKVATGEGGHDCLLNKADDDFPTLNTMAAEVEHLTVGPRTKRVQRMGPWSLVPVLPPPAQEASRHWCTHCSPEKTPEWRPGLQAGASTLCNVCAHPLKDSAAAAASWTNTLFREARGRLPHSNSPCLRARPSKKRHHSSKEDKSSALGAPRATTKGRRRVTAMETTCRQANVLAHGDLRAEKVPPVLRCTHCATEKTPQWRLGPKGLRTLCNACGLVFKKKGRLFREYRPANSPTFSPLLHSNTHRQSETTSAACHGGAPSALMEGQLLQPANGPASCSTMQRSSLLLRQSVVGATSKAIRGEARHESMEVQQPLPERPPSDRPSFALVYHRRVPECRRKSQEENFAAIRTTAKD